jgi:HD-like signal output (HDOD) protein
MDNELILRRLRSVNMLPTFPNMVRQVIGIIEDPMSSASDLARHMDPSMVGEVLRIANTAYFGTRNFRNISTVEHAIAVIGFEHLSYILLQMPFLGMVSGTDTGFDRQEFIRHSILAGVTSKALSLAMVMADPGQVYLGGMMHDVGIIVMYRYFKEEWLRVLDMIHGEGISRLEAERAVLGVDHGYIGAKLLELWNIPKAITEGVMFHHCPEMAGEYSQNVTVVTLGNAFSKSVGLSTDLDEFDDFMKKHKHVLEGLSVLKEDFSPSEEVVFMERIYTMLRDVKGYIENVVEGKDD